MAFIFALNSKNYRIDQHGRLYVSWRQLHSSHMMMTLTREVHEGVSPKGQYHKVAAHVLGLFIQSLKLGAE